jgi:hypothetical protein
LGRLEATMAVFLTVALYSSVFINAVNVNFPVFLAVVPKIVFGDTYNTVHHIISYYVT